MMLNIKSLTVAPSNRLTTCADDNRQETPQLSPFVAIKGDDSYRNSLCLGSNCISGGGGWAEGVL